MTEDEKETMIYRLWEEFREPLGTVSDDMKYGFMAGARAAIFEIGAKAKTR